MHTYPSDQQRFQHKAPSSGLQRFLFTFMLLSLSTIIILLLIIGQPWQFLSTPGSQPTPPPGGALSPTPSPSRTSTPTLAPTPTPTPVLAQRIDTYIDHLTLTQQIGQVLMLPVYTNGYTARLNQPLQQWEIANVIVYNQYNGEPLMPTTLSGLTQLVHDLQAHANQALMSFLQNPRSYTLLVMLSRVCSACSCEISCASNCVTERKDAERRMI